MCWPVVVVASDLEAKKVAALEFGPVGGGDKGGGFGGDEVGGNLCT